MKIIEGMVLTPVGNDWVAVPTGEAADALHGVVRLNKTGKVVWDGLAEGLTKEQIVDSLTERFEVDDETAGAAVEAAMAKLADAGLLV